MIKKRVYKWHRWLSALAAIPLLMWSGSGLLHQAGAWVKPVFKKETYAAVSGKQEIESIIEHQYRKNSAILSIKKIKAFNHHYTEKNKVLPVYEVSLASADETVFYIDLAGGKIVSGSNRNSRAIHTWFGYLHKWSFLQSVPVFRVCIIMAFSLTVLLAALLGIYLYYLLPAFNKKFVLTSNQVEKLWHRRLGIIVSVFMLFFAFAGFMHTIGDLYPSFKTIEKPFFDQLHMHRYTEAIGPTFRFWWLFGLAAMLVLMVVSGLVLFVRVIQRNLSAMI